MNAAGHSAITSEAIKALTAEEQNWLGKEKDFLIKVYCQFPDMKWPWGGQLGGESGHPQLPRCPDLPREWNVHYYCCCDPLCPERELLPAARHILPPAMPAPSLYPKVSAAENRYCPMGAYWAPAVFLPKIIEALEEGCFEDGIRFMGALIHHVQDRAAFAYWPDLHKIANLEEPDLMHLGDYSPTILGSSVGECVKGTEERMRQIIEFDKPLIPQIRSAYRDGENRKIQHLILQFWQEACRATADLMHTVIALTDGGHYVNYWGYWLQYPQAGNPAMLNLLDNPSFEAEDGSGMPQGWFINWHDLDDKIGRAEWDWSRMHSVFSSLVRHGERSVKIMWAPQDGIEWLQRWPCAIKHLNRGERYHCTAWVKTMAATGENCLRIYLYDGINLKQEIKTESVNGNHDWQQLQVEFEIPQGTDRMRLACHSSANTGAVWFDDLELRRLEQ